ncbi:MAG TPA: hypothetical protein VE915_00610 [Actinomycetota bacterium]|nr:hypothetical protein [Actinomycetota bacterium]
MNRGLMVAAALAIAATTCGRATDVEGGNERPQETTVQENSIRATMQDYAFSVEGEAGAGEVLVEFTNRGDELHDAIIGRLEEGKTLEDVQRLLQGGPQGPPPPWFDDAPMDMGIVGPGETSGIVVDAEEGTYALLCFMTDPQGVPHAAQGMVQTFEVGPAGTSTEIQPDEQIVMSATGAEAPRLSSGSSILEVTNEAAQAGEVLVLQLAQGRTLEDVESWFRRGQKGPVPATFHGGTHAIEPGASAKLTFTLDPGRYSIVASFGEGEDIRDIATEFTISA